MQVGLHRITINSCVCILSSLLFNLYAIVYLLIIIYLHIIVSCIHLFKFAKRDHHPIHPLSKVITIGWISLIFLTQMNFKNPIFSRIVLISFGFSNDLLFLLILHKHECNFHNSRIMEFVRRIRARQIRLWWGPRTYEFSLLIVNCYA